MSGLKNMSMRALYNSRIERRRIRIQELADLLGVRYLVLDHFNGWSVQVDGIGITRSVKGKPLIRRRFPTRNKAEKILLEELKGMVQHHERLHTPSDWSDYE